MMRTKVALVEAHPDSIAEDYRRVLDLAGIAAMMSGRRPTLILGMKNRRFRPGWTATPWQLAGVLAWLGAEAKDVTALAVDRKGAGPIPAGPVWQDSLTDHQALNADPGWWRPHRPALDLLHPALDARLSAGVTAPLGLAESPSLLMAAPAMNGDWGVAAACPLLYRLIVGDAGRPRGPAARRKAPMAEVIAEAVGVARGVATNCGAVIDGTLWGVGAEANPRGYVARNVLLAGTDPVAVDAVAARLAGLEPRRVPWLRICHDRGFGRVLPDEIDLVGAADLLELDFDLSDSTLAPGRAAGLSRLIGRLGAIGRSRSRQAAERLAGSPWEMLNTNYASGKRRRNHG